MGAMKELYTDVTLYMLDAAENLTKAAKSGDAELMQAVLINTQSTIGSYINALAGVR